MDFWDEYLKNPPTEVTFPGHWHAKPDDFHCVRWVGYETGLELDELWQFGRGMRGKCGWLPERGFPKYGGETLCGLPIENGRNMYAPRWESIEPVGYRPEPPNGDKLRTVLADLHAITCMVCRNRLIYEISRLIEDLTYIRSHLVGDWLGEEYISREPLVHGKHVTRSEHDGRFYSESYRFRCNQAKTALSPQMADDVKKAERITCPECLAILAAGVIP